MSKLPGARVVRGGSQAEGTAGAGGTKRPAVEPQGQVLQLAPRHVPRPLIVRLLFGGIIALFGWLFAAFGMIFVLFFVPSMELGSGGYDERTTGTVTRVEPTDMSENERVIHRVHYTFRDEAGALRQGASYTTDPPDRPGEWDVSYRSDEPSRSQLVGMRRQPFSLIGLFTLLFPIVGLAIAGWQLVGGLRNLRLLRYGAETRGKLTGKRPTSTTVNDTPVMELTFEYEADGRRHIAKVKTQTPALLEDDALEAMLYDPHAPSRATPLDHLPGGPVVTPAGVLEARPGITFHLLLLPLAFAGLVVATVVRMI
jgi:hypothetical protein